MRLFTIAFMLVLSFALGGCFGSNSESNAPMSSGLPYYYAEFSDVAIPNEMQPDKGDVFISYTGDGVKLGTQYFKGRVEIASLVNAMQGHMRRDGWNLRSVFRARGAIMIFEVPTRMCSIYIHEDAFFSTGMLVFVSPKLGDGALQYSVPSTSSEPLSFSEPPLNSSPSYSNSSGTGSSTNNGNITVYPAN